MPLRRVMVVALAIVAAAAAVGASDALAFLGRASSTQQTHPGVTPRVGRRHSKFVLTFTLAQSPGRTGLVQTSYRPVVTPPAQAPHACSPTQPPPILTGDQGSTARVLLPPPMGGWCRGRYAVTVFLESSDLCGPPIRPTAAVICPDVEPAFPIQQFNTGQVRFTVR